MAPFQQKEYKGWIGAVMMMDYLQSAAGPYRELLFIPGLIRRGKKWGFSVSKIYTSTEISRQSGVYNWGIPKEAAQFEWKHLPEGAQQIRVEANGKPILEAQLKPGKGSVPVSTKLFPLNRLVQLREEELLLTRPTASGHLGFAFLHHLVANPELFPPVHERKPLAVLSFREFNMHFPPAFLLPQQ